MNTKTMEGIAGSASNMKLLETPFRVFKEARRKGDITRMKRAMEYVNDFSDKAEEYKEKAAEGMEEEVEEAREKEKAERGKALEKRRKEREKNENKHTDTVEISEEGRVILKEKTGLGQTDPDSGAPSKSSGDAAGLGTVLYTKTGEAGTDGKDSGAGLSVSV